MFTYREEEKVRKENAQIHKFLAEKEARDIQVHTLHTTLGCTKVGPFLPTLAQDVNYMKKQF